jgi:hypothetical protein
MAKGGFKLTRSAEAKFHKALAAANKPFFTPAQLKQLADLSNRSAADLRPQFARQLETPVLSMDEIGDSISDELAELRKLITELKTPTPPVVSSAPRKRGQPQVDRTLRAIQELYPNGIDGILDSVVRQKVADYLEPETKKGRAVPDRRSMNRALRQYRTR